MGDESAVCQDEFRMVDELSRVTSWEVPAPLAGLKDKEIRFTKTVERTDMTDVVLGMLGIE